ncbi:hypothetical protein PFICI_14131 [Pestalotiopsis fici W106-1]|uniref:Uncharacterized protein n=1 Tax=Pestalotiopsis fici (strain W106-1 / CGMCC3.15140) TaxID=1229662 RepID=W3WK36_PESFW|nr:uncharacterized protein PFICI_14131 [Pestalotiopsis fici W106-1]ETS74265.1 hypothetical protein PFICI_14131 [Pestalotiopsis fici W106-1]
MTGRKDSYPAAQTGKIDAEFKPHDPTSATEGAKAFAAHQAHPGPAVPQSMPEQEGSKEERQAKAKELNK